jgi:hypothetical protein
MRTPYCTVEDVENYLLTEVDPAFEPQVELWIRGVSDVMDRMSNRKLVADTTGSGEDEFEEKYFDGNGKSSLRIDDAVEVDSVEVGESEVEFETYPKKAPHRAIISQTGFARGIQNVKVMAKWGLFEEVPDDLRLACSILVAGIINVSLKKQGIKSEQIGNYKVTYADDQGLADYERAKGIIHSYRKYDF